MARSQICAFFMEKATTVQFFISFDCAAKSIKIGMFQP